MEPLDSHVRKFLVCAGSQVALVAAQEEASTSVAQAMEAQARADALSERLQQDLQQRRAKWHTSLSLLHSAATSSLSAAAAAASSEAGQSRDQEHKGLSLLQQDPEVSPLIEKLKAQQAEISVLQESLASLRGKRDREAAQAAQATEQLAASERKVRSPCMLPPSLRMACTLPLNHAHTKAHPGYRWPSTHTEPYTIGSMLSWLPTQVRQLQSQVGDLELQVGSLQGEVDTLRHRDQQHLAKATDVIAPSSAVSGASAPALAPSSAPSQVTMVQLEALASAWREALNLQKERVAQLEQAAEEATEQMDQLQAELAAALAKVGRAERSDFIARAQIRRREAWELQF